MLQHSVDLVAELGELRNMGSYSMQPRLTYIFMSIFHTAKEGMALLNLIYHNWNCIFLWNPHIFNTYLMAFLHWDYLQFCQKQNVVTPRVDCLTKLSATVNVANKWKLKIDIYENVQFWLKCGTVIMLQKLSLLWQVYTNPVRIAQDSVYSLYWNWTVLWCLIVLEYDGC